jgi:hypothetical protein
MKLTSSVINLLLIIFAAASWIQAQQPSSPCPASIPDLSKCPTEGCGGDPYLNVMKNRKCIPIDPEPVLLTTIRRLREPETWRKGQDRASIQMEEQKAVQVMAYMTAAFISGRETANCSLLRRNNQSFHLALATRPGEPRRETVSAIITPRLRPKGLMFHELQRLANTKAFIRVTGWMMLNTLHIRSPLVRSTNWEIHPVTKFEICTSTISQCKQGSGWKDIAGDFVDNRQAGGQRVPICQANPQDQADYLFQRVDKAAQKAGESFRMGISGLKEISENNLVGLSGDFYQANEVATVLTNTKGQFLQGLQGSQLQGLRSFVALEFPSPRRLTIYRDDDGRQLVEQREAQALFARATAVIAAVYNNDSEIEINITSRPDDATFQLMSFEGEAIQKVCTNGCPVSLYRGYYKYAVIRPGFKKQTFDLQLMNSPPKLKLECRLVEERDANNPSPCKVTNIP